MREEERTRLDRLLRKVVAAWIPALAVLAVVFVGLFVFRATVRDERPVSGTVAYASWRLNDDTGQRYPDIQVVLDDAALVRAGSMATGLPPIGARVMLRERVMLLGNTTYEWDGPEPAHNSIPTAAATPVSLP